MVVVAADGGWMPQSAEHLAAIDALGVAHGLLVVTRADLADPGPALREAAAEIAMTSLGDVERVAVSAVTGQGMPELRACLARLAATHARRAAIAAGDGDSGGAVRLWVDRAFTIRGSGTVVTGTLPAGTVRTGQELLLTPSQRPVRVRSLQSLGQPAGEVTGVARVALNLRGIPPDLPRRGMALVEPGRWTMTSQVDVRVERGGGRLPGQPLAHIGAARVPARLRVLAAPPPGGDTAAYARLTLREPLPLHVGDRLLLRDPGTRDSGAPGSAALILGATVLDVAPAALRRRGGALAAGREMAQWPAVPRAGELLRRHGILRAAALSAMGVTSLPEPVAGDWLVDPERWALLREALPRAVAEFTARDPLAPGMPVEAARASLGLPSRDLVVPLAAATGQTAAEAVTLDGGYLRLAGASRPGSLPPGVADAIGRVLRGLAESPFAAPDAQRLRELGLDGKALAAAARGGLLLRVADQVVLAPGADDKAIAILANLPQPFTMSQARQALGTTRRVAVPLLEYLERTRRAERLPGDLHRLRLPGADAEALAVPGGARYLPP